LAAGHGVREGDAVAAAALAHASGWLQLLPGDFAWDGGSGRLRSREG